MPQFEKSNGIQGVGSACHTATGYECVANYPANEHNISARVMFYVKHVVGSDGHPYTELGLSGLHESEKNSAIEQIKADLKKAKMIEVMCLTDVAPDSNTFSEQLCSDFTSVSVRVCAGKSGITTVMGVMGKVIEESSRKFVREQEQVPNVLFESILTVMGKEMDRGPGGHKMAIEKARDLAHYFENGIDLAEAS